MAYQKKYSLADRINYYGKKYDVLKTKSHLSKKEYGQMMHARGFLGATVSGKYFDSSLMNDLSYSAGFVRGGLAQTKAHLDFKF